MRALKFLAIGVATLLILVAGVRFVASMSASKHKAANATAVPLSAAQPSEPLPVTPSASVPVQLEDSKPTLEPTVSAFRGWFERDGLVFESAPLADGTPRLVGQPSDKLPRVELVGPGEHLESASLTFARPVDDTRASMRNIGAIMLLTQNTGWDGGKKWATSAMGKDATKIHGAVRYEMRTVKGLDDVYTLTVSPVAGDDGALTLP